MPTFVLPSGRLIYNGDNALDRPTIDLFDAEANNPFFLADWLAWQSTPSAGRNPGWAYPFQFDGAASGYVLEGGRFIGNIPRNQNRSGPDGFYTSGTPQRYNAALLQIRHSVPGTLRGLEFGVLNDLDSGFCDGLRIALSTNAFHTVDRCIFSSARDDCIEADTTQARLDVIDSIFENVYSWISATGNGNTMTGKVINVTDSICRYRAWPESGGNSQIGPVFKIDGAGNAPVFNMTRVTLLIPNSWPESGYNRTRGALTRMNVTDCDLLVTGGQLSNVNGLRDAFIGRGWNLIENTSEANDIWASVKAAKLLEIGGGGGPIVEPSLTSPLTINTTV